MLKTKNFKEIIRKIKHVQKKRRFLNIQLDALLKFKIFSRYQLIVFRTYMCIVFKQ